MVLSEIYIYPIKSAAGVKVDQTPVDISGPRQDRRWMLVDREGRFLTQRELPRMVLMHPKFRGDNLFVEAPGMPALEIPSWAGDGDWISVRVWHNDLRLPHPNPAYSEWFSSFLRHPCRLVHLPDTVVRPVEAPYNSPQWRVSLADGYPLLLVGQASLDLLNQRLPSPVTMRRFRPNLVIAGSAAHDEDGWRRLRIGDVEIRVVKPCARCKIVLVDPETAESGTEPLQTLGQYRKKNQKIFFAQNALVTATGVLRAGCAVEVLEANHQD